MTPYSPDTDSTVAALQATQGTGHWTGLPTAELIRRGDRARRRRHVLQAGGGLTGIAAVVALVMAIGPTDRGASEVVPAGGGTPSPAPWRPAAVTGPSTTQVLVQYLGPDFREASKQDHGAIEVVPGSPAARELPAGYGASADIQVLPTRPAGASAADDPSGLPPLTTLCAPAQEKGDVSEACIPAQLPDGRTVQVQHVRYVAGSYSTYGGRWTPGSTDTTMVYYQRPDDSIVRVRLTAYDAPDTSTAARQKQAAAWLPQWTTALEQAAADPRVGLPPGPATSHPALSAAQQQAQQEIALLQESLGTAWDLGDGHIYLEPGSSLEGQLPDKRYSGTATLAHLETADLQEACGTDLTDCSTVTLPDGTKAYAITTAQPWTDSAQTATPAPGSPVEAPPQGDTGVDLRTTVYLPRADGQVVATAVELVSNIALTPTERTDEIPAEKAWLKALQPELAQAAQLIGQYDTKEATTTQGN